MRIISAHYAWDSFRGFIKNPLLYIDENNEVVKLIGMGDEYAEHAHVEFFGGLIIPGFVSNLNFEEVGSSIEHQLNISFAKGSMYVSDGSINRHTSTFESRVNPKVISSDCRCSSQVPWDRICEQVQKAQETKIEVLLHAYLYQPWAQIGRLDLGGSFNEKTKSGVLVLNGINWAEMKFNCNLSFKIVHIPY